MRPAPQILRSALPRRAVGLTLVELLVVLTLMAIIAAIALPILGPGVSNTDLKTAARTVAAGLRMARNDAVATRMDTRVVLDLEHRTFQIERDSVVHALPREMQMKLFTAQNDLISETTGAIRFFPDGGSNGGRITLAAGERKYEVDVDWLTGRVAILD
jgi:general secretion pathway protein H